MEHGRYSDGWTLGELAEAAGVSPRTVKEWDHEGLLPEPTRAPLPGQGKGRAPYRYPLIARAAACSLGRWRAASKVSASHAKAFLWLEGFDYLPEPPELTAAQAAADVVMALLSGDDVAERVDAAIDRSNDYWRDTNDRGRDPMPQDAQFAVTALVQRLAGGPSWEKPLIEGLSRAMAEANSEPTGVYDDDGNEFHCLGPREVVEDAYLESGYDRDRCQDLTALLGHVLGGKKVAALDAIEEHMLDKMLSWSRTLETDPRPTWQALCRLTNHDAETFSLLAAAEQAAYRRGPKTAMIATLVFTRFGGLKWLQWMENTEAWAESEFKARWPSHKQEDSPMATV